MGLPVFDTQFEARLTKKIARAMDEFGGTVTAGRCPDHAEYRYECGRIEGLYMAREFMNEVRRELLGGGEQDAA
jgi:hypothetical protein